MAAYEQLQGRLTAVDMDAYLAEDEPAAPLARELKPNQLCAFAQGNSFVHDLPAPQKTSSAKSAAGRELRQVRPRLPEPRHPRERVWRFAPATSSSPGTLPINAGEPPRSRRRPSPVPACARMCSQKWTLLGRDELTKACQITLEDVRRQCADIPCMGCRSAIESLLTQLAARPNGTQLGPFSVLEERVVKLRGDIASDPDQACESLLGCRHAETDAWISKSKTAQKGNRRCPLHSLKPRPVGAWIDVWLVMSEDCHRAMLSALTAETFEDALQAYLRKHKFCSHCRSVVLEAYDMLILDRHSSRTGDGHSDESDEDGHGHSDEDGLDVSPDADIAHAERMFKKLSYVDGRIVIPNDSTYVQELLDRAERSMRGEEQSHHVKQGSLGQDEVLSCLGGCLYEELQSLWRQMVNNERSWCMLQHVVSSATLTNVEVKVDEKTGDRIMLELLAEEEAQKTADEQKRSKKKRQKDKKKAKKKALEEEKASEPEPEPAAPPAEPEPAKPQKNKKEKKKEQHKSTLQQPSKPSGSESSEGSEGELLDQFSSVFAEGLTGSLGAVGHDDNLRGSSSSSSSSGGGVEDPFSLGPEEGAAAEEEEEEEEGEEEEGGGLSEAEILAFKNKYANTLSEEKEKRAEKLRQNWDMRKAKGVAAAKTSPAVGGVQLDGDIPAWMK